MAKVPSIGQVAPCERLNHIEAGLPADPKNDVDDDADIRWMVGQIRSWQKFAKRVVDFGDVLKAEGASPAVLNGYEGVFAPPPVT